MGSAKSRGSSGGLADEPSSGASGGVSAVAWVAACGETSEVGLRVQGKGEGVGARKWAERYEALRAHATGQAPLGFIPLGLALLRHRGVAAWMAAESSAPNSQLLSQAYKERERSSMDEFDACRSELVRLLAGAALLASRRRVR